MKNNFLKQFQKAFCNFKKEIEKRVRKTSFFKYIKCSNVKTNNSKLLKIIYFFIYI